MVSMVKSVMSDTLNGKLLVQLCMSVTDSWYDPENKLYALSVVNENELVPLCHWYVYPEPGIPPEILAVIMPFPNPQRVSVIR